MLRIWPATAVGPVSGPCEEPLHATPVISTAAVTVATNRRIDFEVSNWYARVFSRDRVPRCNRRRQDCEIDHELVCARRSGRAICLRGLTKLQGWELAPPHACHDAHLSDRDAHAPYRCVSRRCWLFR